MQAVQTAIEKLSVILAKKDLQQDISGQMKSLILIFNLIYQCFAITAFSIMYSAFGIASTSQLALFYSCTLICFIGIFYYYRAGTRPILAHLIFINSIFIIFGSALIDFETAVPSFCWFHITAISGLLFLNARAVIVWLVTIIALAWLIPAGGGAYDHTLAVKEVSIFARAHLTLSLAVLFFQLSIYLNLKRILFEKLELADQDLLNRLEENRRLVRIVTHDIANPLFNLELMISRIASKPELIADTQNKMRRSTNTIREIITDVRSLQVVIDGVKSLDLKPCSLDQIIAETIEDFAERASQKNIEIKYLPRSFQVQVEPHILKHQVLANLISNAIKFTFQGNKIEVSAEQHGEMVQIHIKDFGTGIKATTIPKLFLITEKTSSKGTAGETGTGYGLPICKSVLELMGGGITVESQHIDENPNAHGTTFTVQLKAAATAVHSIYDSAI